MLSKLERVYQTWIVVWSVVCGPVSYAVSCTHDPVLVRISLMDHDNVAQILTILYRLGHDSSIEFLHCIAIFYLTPHTSHLSTSICHQRLMRSGGIVYLKRPFYTLNISSKSNFHPSELLKQ